MNIKRGQINYTSKNILAKIKLTNLTPISISRVEIWQNPKINTLILVSSKNGNHTKFIHISLYLIFLTNFNNLLYLLITFIKNDSIKSNIAIIKVSKNVTNT